MKQITAYLSSPKQAKPRIVTKVIPMSYESEKKEYLQKKNQL